ALVFDAESSHRNVVDAVYAFRQLVFPRHIIDRACREHFDIGVPGEPLGDVPGVQFCAAIDGVAIPLNDEGELHWSPSWPSTSPASCSSGESGSSSGASWWAASYGSSPVSVAPCGSCATLAVAPGVAGPGAPCAWPITAAADPPPPRRP